jgi:Vitamin K-dependent gamma-carboxylase
MSWWNNYWFRPSPLVDLAVVRIVAVMTQLLLVWLKFDVVMANVTLMPDQWFVPLPILNLLTFSFGEPYRPSAEVVEVIWFATFGAGLLALIGLLTNLSLMIFATGSVFLQAVIYSFGDYHHPEAVMMLALGVLALSPAGATLSVDRLLRNRKARNEGPRLGFLQETSRFATWPILTLQWIFVLMYLSAVLHKLVFTGTDWLNGFTLQAKLIQDGLRWDSPLALLAAEHHTLVYALQVFTIRFQGTFALAVLFPKLRWIYVPLGLAFHIGILLTLTAPFYEWMALYVIFIPWSQAFHFASRCLGQRGQVAAAKV